MKWFTYIFPFFVLFVNCSSKQVVSSQTSERTKALITEKRFSIDCTRAYPTPTRGLQAVANAGLLAPGNSVGQINISGSQNQFKIVGDSIAVSLPFYGEQRLAGLSYGRKNTGIQFNGIPDVSNFDGKDKKGNQVLNFTFKNDTEQCQAQIKIFPSGKSDIYITSSHRTSMRYTGSINSLEVNN